MGRHRKNMPILPEDSEFFETFYDQYRNFMFYLARDYTTNPAELEDLVQEVVVHLMNNVYKLKNADHSKACNYIRETVRTTYLDLYRKNKGRLCLDEELLQILVEKEHKLLPDLFTYWEIEQLRRGLTCREWLVLEGKYVIGYSSEELGQLLGVTPDSVRCLLSRARKRSREILSVGNRTGGGGIE